MKFKLRKNKSKGRDQGTPFLLSMCHGSSSLVGIKPSSVHLQFEFDPVSFDNFLGFWLWIHSKNLMCPKDHKIPRFLR